MYIFETVPTSQAQFLAMSFRLSAIVRGTHRQQLHRGVSLSGSCAAGLDTYACRHVPSARTDIVIFWAYSAKECRAKSRLVLACWVFCSSLRAQLGASVSRSSLTSVVACADMNRDGLPDFQHSGVNLNGDRILQETRVGFVTMAQNAV